MTFPAKATISSLLTDPLFSTVITLYILILLYFPTLFLTIIFSPVLISTFILLLSLLRLGAIQRTAHEQNPNNPSSAAFKLNQTHDFLSCDRNWVSPISGESSETGPDSGPKDKPCSFYDSSFVEWDVRAPLEVIYEEYEGEGGDDDDDVLEEKRDAQMSIIERYASLSKFYPESDDSDTSSEEDDFPAIRDWDSPGSMCFRCEGEDRDGLIEIALEGKGFSDGEDENLIEIELFPVG